MNPIRYAIQRPIAVIAAVLMAVLFGYLALTTIPIQLTPDVRKPVITVETGWPGAAPVEVEREIVNPQEDELKGLEGLESMTSRSQTGTAEITLEFAIGTDMNRALLLVANRLDRVSTYPDEADEPVLGTSGSEDNPIAWFIIKRAEGNTTPIHQFGDFADDVVREAFERVEGVSGTNVFGGSERELQIIIKPERLAQYRLTIPEIMNKLRSENISASAGDVEEGKRRFVVRSEGQLNSIEAVRDVVLRSGASDDGAAGGFGRLRVADVADVRFGYRDPTTRIRHRGEPAIAVNIVRETGANVIETMDAVRAVRDELTAGPLARENLTFEQVYDETVYINGAIDLVIQNIWLGGLLAAGVLMLFLRSPRATLIVSIAIPISVIASFVAMSALGRTLNVISLAGIAFAVGMVVDAAIVVLENIYRLRQSGLSAADAAYQGAKQVWGAILVSALTTVLVFVPILTMELEAGQLFRDIAVAISVSVLLSLLVAVTVIPALSSRLLAKGVRAKPVTIPVVDHFARGFRWIALKYVTATNASREFGLLVVMVVSAAAIVFVTMTLPKLEYLPEGNRNLVFGVLIPPPGYNLDTTFSIAERVEAAARPLWEKPLEADAPGEPPAIDSFFFVARPGTSFVGANAKNGQRAGELIPILSQPIFSEPGTFGFMTQPSIFGRGIGGGRAIELNVSGPEIEPLLAVAGRAAGLIAQYMPRDEGHQFRPLPGLELGSPEVRVEPDRLRLADAGVSAAELAATIDTYNDGARVAEITVGAEIIDLTLKGETDGIDERTQSIGRFPVVTENGRIVPAASVATVRLTAGPTEIRHRERLRTITLEVRPSNDLPLEAALELLQNEVVAPIEADGLPPGVRFTVSGTADELTKTWSAIQLNLLFALLVVYLVMAILFESFALPLVVMISVPVAAAGGVGGLALLNLLQDQPLDMLTLLGFVILIGIVVNNAILIVHQTLYHHREEGLAAGDAILEATNNRIRPIFMSTLTSVVGMLPLVLVPGAGSELYRGLGSVVVGGLALSAVLTLLIVPPLMRLVLGIIDPQADLSQTKRVADKVAAPAE